NDRDQALLRSAVSDAAANLLALVPSLGTREVLAFGEGVAVPTRLKFKHLDKERLPRSEAGSTALSASGSVNDDFIDTVIDRWRGATMSHKPQQDGSADVETAARNEFNTVTTAPAPPDPGRFKILKKPLDASDALAGSLGANPAGRWPAR
ncbi:MAG: hypothetical protein IT538_08445, partial [Variibacter sp.]|nr:hypothetical protein [Variibacter sp.]